MNYVQDPDEIIDYRGPDLHEPTPNMLAYLMEVDIIALVLIFFSGYKVQFVSFDDKANIYLTMCNSLLTLYNFV